MDVYNRYIYPGDGYAKSEWTRHVCLVFFFSIKIQKLHISYFFDRFLQFCCFYTPECDAFWFSTLLPMWLEVEAGVEGVCLRFQSPDVTQCHFNYLVISLCTTACSVNTRQEICHATVHAAKQSWLLRKWIHQYIQANLTATTLGFNLLFPHNATALPLKFSVCTSYLLLWN